MKCWHCKQEITRKRDVWLLEGGWWLWGFGPFYHPLHQACVEPYAKANLVIPAKGLGNICVSASDEQGRRKVRKRVRLWVLTIWFLTLLLAAGIVAGNWGSVSPIKIIAAAVFLILFLTLRFTVGYIYTSRQLKQIEQMK